MTKKLAIMVLFMQISATAVLGETKEGTCQLMLRQGFENDVFQVSVGKEIKGTCKFFLQDFLGKKIIYACVALQNTSDKALHCQYYVAFFDDAGNLIGCAGQGTFGQTGLKAGQSTLLGSCLIPLPAGFHEKAVRYKIAFYESDKEIGKDASAGTGTTGPARPPTDLTRPPTSISARTWTDATGGHTLVAKFVELKDGTVRLKTGNGKIISVPLEKLSGADQEYLKGTIKASSANTSMENRSKQAGPGSARSKPANAGPQPAKWYSAGPGWEELTRVAQSRNVQIQSSNHGEKEYAAILSQSQPGSTIVLLFALDNSDKNVPDSYRDLLPMPWAQAEAKLRKGETVEASGSARDREIILLAAPQESQLRQLIRQTKLLPSSPAPVR